MPLLFESVPPALPLVPPTELLALEPLGYVLELGVLSAVLAVLPLPLGVVLAVLPVVLAMLLALLPPALALVPLMLYFCSRSATRELSVETCCRICSMSLGLATVELAVVVVDDDGVGSVVVLLLAVAGAPGAGVVATT
jgi:hypothetical protein